MKTCIIRAAIHNLVTEYSWSYLQPKEEVYRDNSVPVGAAIGLFYLTEVSSSEAHWSCTFRNLTMEPGSNMKRPKTFGIPWPSAFNTHLYDFHVCSKRKDILK